MVDVFTPKKRSEVMSRIKGRGNRDTELALAKLLRANKITGWRRHYRVEGKPDFAFPSLKVAVFVDGCFWHQCPKCSYVPQNNHEFWEKKLHGNVVRDRAVTRTLRRSDWTVVRIWEHDLRDSTRVLRRVRAALKSARQT